MLVYESDPITHAESATGREIEIYMALFVNESLFSAKNVF